jgi:hypothetical protein
MSEKNKNAILSAQDRLKEPYSRRRFLSYSGLVVAGAGVLLSCNDDDNDGLVVPDEVNLGTGDIGILNYAYALEQLEAAFYMKVAQSKIEGMTDGEMSLLTDIRDHEIAHREFFKNALGTNAIGALEVDFGAVDFTKRDSVLATAKAFEDLGVSAYNGAGKLLKSDQYLLIAGKIVSVEARHAAYIRDLISNGSFADQTVVNAQGLDKSRTPTEVLTIASAFVKSKINFSGLPK